MDDELAFAGPGPSGGVGNVPCAVCGARTAMCCSACEAVFYCSPACQQRDWKEHWKVCGTQQQLTPQQVERSPVWSPGGRPESDDGEGFEVALPQSNFASAAAAQAAATSAARDRRLRLRVSAVLASRESRHQDALQHAAEAYEVAQRLGSLHVEGKSMADEGGVAELEGPALVELLLIVRAALALNDFGTGLGFLEMLTATVDRLAGVGGNPALMQPSEAASLLCCTSELCALYNHEERAEDYAHAYLGVTRLAHGEGSKEVGDAHAFLCGLFTRRKRYQEAILHAASTLKIRQRHASYGAEKPVADAYWNLAVLQYQLGQHRAALDSLEASREVHQRITGEGVATSNTDLALGQVWTILGEAGRAMRSYRQAVRWRQRTLGFAHAETRRAASLLAAAEIEAHAEEEWRRDVEADAEDGDTAPVARPRPRQRPQEGPSPGPGGVPSQPPRDDGQAKALMGDPSHKAANPMMFGDESLASSPSRADASPMQASSTGVKSNEGNIIECIAGEEDKPLGMTPASVPPGQVLLKTIVAGSWADRCGLKAGMELLSVNGKEVKTLTAEDFKTVLRQIPVTIRVGKVPGPAAAVQPDPAVSAAAQAASGKEVEPITFSVPDSAKTVGCLFTSVPPGRVFIKKVDGGSWADQQGIQVGWELFSLNGESCDAMQADTFRSSMRTRPLTLTFKAEAGSPLRDNQAPSTRKEVIKTMFSVVDVSKTGRLRRREMFIIAQQMGFPESEADYQDEYEALCTENKSDPKVGLNMVAFDAIMNDKAEDSQYYRDDVGLLQCLQELQKTAGKR